MADDTNSLYKDPFAPGVYAFPTLAELIKKTEEVVVAQKFDDRLRDEYIGSIRARLMSLLVGSKGAMLNTYRSINFRDLLHRHIIFELEDIRSTEEKSLIMGFIIWRIVKLSATPLRNRPHMVFCSQGTSWGAGSTHGTSVGCNPLAYP